MTWVSEREWAVAIEAALRAGTEIRQRFGGNLHVRYKRANDPVTEADLAANRVIEDSLRRAFPDHGWLSEETRDSKERLHRGRVWIVDPLDGSREFVEQIPEFVVCIALAVEGEAVLGIAYNPVREELFCGARQRGMFLNGKPAKVSTTADLQQARFLASRSEDRRGEWDEFKGELRVELTGSVAYKLALIAAGKADATFSLTPKNEWDICAGAALIEAGGGKITDRYGQPLRFNQENTRLPGIIATNGFLHDAVLELLQAHGKLGTA